MPAFEISLKKFENPHYWLVLDTNKDAKGWIMTFDRMGERWFTILLERSLQKKGWGTRLLDIAKKAEKELVGWVIDQNTFHKKDGTIYPSPIEFYKKKDFQVISDVRFENEKISAVKIRWKRS